MEFALQFPFTITTLALINRYWKFGYCLQLKPYLRFTVFSVKETVVVSVSRQPC